MSKAISELTAAGTLTGTEQVEIVQNGSKRTTTQEIADLASAGTGVETSIELVSHLYDDYNVGPSGHMSLANINNGGGAGSVGISVVGVDSTEKASGVLSCTTATSTGGGAGIINTTYLMTFGFGFQYTLSHRTAISALSDGTDTYTVRVGFSSSASTTPGDGAYFRYTHGTNSGKWQAVTVSNTTETAQDTGIAPTALVYQVFKIVVDSTAANVYFYIDGVLVNTITTNIINSSSRICGQVASIIKTAGSTARILYVDFWEMITERVTAR